MCCVLSSTHNETGLDSHRQIPSSARYGREAARRELATSPSDVGNLISIQASQFAKTKCHATISLEISAFDVMRDLH